MYMWFSRTTAEAPLVPGGTLPVVMCLCLKFQNDILPGIKITSRVWHLDFRLGAWIGLLIKNSGHKQDFWGYILFWAPSLKILGPTAKSRGICAWAPGKVEPWLGIRHRQTLQTGEACHRPLGPHVCSEWLQLIDDATCFHLGSSVRKQQNMSTAFRVSWDYREVPPVSLANRHLLHLPRIFLSDFTRIVLRKTNTYIGNGMWLISSKPSILQYFFLEVLQPKNCFLVSRVY